MKILIAHSYYQQRGGEDAVFNAERDALIDVGNEVKTYVLHNADYVNKPKWQQVLSLFWNHQAYREICKQIRAFHPSVLHVHNLFPFFSPSILWAARKENIPVVVTLHNYRLICANGLFYRDDKACEECVGKLFPWPAVKYSCYRQDRAQTSLVALSMFFHRLIGSWNIPKYFIAPTKFAAEKFSSIISEERIEIKPHFATSYSLTFLPKNNHAIFVGRLSAEKGFDWLLEAWSSLKADITLDIVGEGTIVSTTDPRIIVHGRLEPERLRSMLAQSAVTIIPSRCYETFSNIVVESFAAGTAVIAPTNTAPASLVTPGVTGSHFSREDVAAFHSRVEEYINDPGRAAREGNNALAEYQQKYQAKENMDMLMEIYQRSINAT